MTNTVTSETGRKLAAAGFPQPSPAPGQWWGDDEMIVFVFRAWINERHNYFLVAQTVADGHPTIDDYFDTRDFGGLVYLPTVGDILRELPDDAELMRTHDRWTIIIRLNGKKMDVTLKDLSEHEAAALAYLSIHEKK